MRVKTHRAIVPSGVHLRRAMACALLCLLSAPALAAEGAQVQLEVRGRIEPKCGFSEVPPPTDLGVLHQGQTISLGILSFRCNLADTANVNLTVQSENGGLQREGGSEKVDYAAAWSVQGHGNFVEASGLTSPVGFTLLSGSPASNEGGEFQVRITGATDGLLAGTYRDRIIYTISP